MNEYLITWYTHVVSAAISITFFVIRGLWMLAESPLLETKPVKVLPHVIDTILLVSAIYLTTLIGQYPFVNSWVTVKVFALIVYILLGIMTLRGKHRSLRAASFAAAVLTFGFIVSVAYWHHPLGIFVLAVY